MGKQMLQNFLAEEGAYQTHRLLLIWRTAHWKKNVHIGIYAWTLEQSNRLCFSCQVYWDQSKNVSFIFKTCQLSQVVGYPSSQFQVSVSRFLSGTPLCTVTSYYMNFCPLVFRICALKQNYGLMAGEKCFVIYLICV